MYPAGPTKFDIASHALMLIGANPVTDFASGSDESQAAGAFFQTTANNWLSLYDWQFATTTVQLNRMSEAPRSAWSAAYQQPADQIKIQNVKVNGINIPFDRFKDKIHCNAGETEDVFCDYTRQIEPEYWPPYFTELMENALAKKFSTVLAAKIDLKASFSGDLETQFRLAKNADARQQTTKRVNMRGRGSIVQVRRGGDR